MNDRLKPVHYQLKQSYYRTVHHIVLKLGVHFTITDEEHSLSLKCLKLQINGHSSQVMSVQDQASGPTVL